MKKLTFSRRGGWSVKKDMTYRSGLEEKIAAQLKAAGIEYTYEKHTVSYVIPASNHKYYPDFILPNGIIIEGKGIFDVKDRQKHLFIKEQHPDLDIRFVFSNPNQKISPKSKTTYAAWCAKHGFLYAKQYIPDEWLRERPKKSRLKGMQKRKE